MNVCIIGAGAAGLCSARQALESKLIPTVFEQTNCIGGTWVYTDKFGTDEYGVDIHSSMYKGLRTNLPKEIMGFPDFPIRDIDTSYISSEQICDFLNDYANHFKLKDHIKYLHHVLRVQPCGDMWQVDVINLTTKEDETYFFGKVMICTGHYHTPMYPNIKQYGTFSGRLLHSHDYKDPSHFKDESVLIVGAGPSGMDICNEISKYARKVTLSHHLKESPKTLFRENVDQKPDVKEFHNNSILFVDGTLDTYNTVLYCTGYKYTFPFLSVDSGIFVDKNFVQPLYKHCVNIKFPSMVFIGIPFYVCAFIMMDLQARFAIKHVWAHTKRISKKEMQLDTEKEMRTRWKLGFKHHQAHMMGPIQGTYYDDLASTGNLKAIDTVFTLLHNESSQRFLDDLTHFREDVFKILDSETFVRIK